MDFRKYLTLKLYEDLQKYKESSERWETPGMPLEFSMQTFIPPFSNKFAPFEFQSSEPAIRTERNINVVPIENQNEYSLHILCKKIGEIKLLVYKNRKLIHESIESINKGTILLDYDFNLYKIIHSRYGVNSIIIEFNQNYVVIHYSFALPSDSLGENGIKLTQYYSEKGIEQLNEMDSFPFLISKYKIQRLSGFPKTEESEIARIMDLHLDKKTREGLIQIIKQRYGSNPPSDEELKKSFIELSNEFRDVEISKREIFKKKRQERLKKRSDLN